MTLPSSVPTSYGFPFFQKLTHPSGFKSHPVYPESLLHVGAFQVPSTSGHMVLHHLFSRSIPEAQRGHGTCPRLHSSGGSAASEQASAPEPCLVLLAHPALTSGLSAALWAPCLDSHPHQGDSFQGRPAQPHEGRLAQAGPARQMWLFPSLS